MIAVDTNILARFYVDDPADPESARQRPTARAIMEASDAVFVPLTVVLELEWVLRSLYGVGTAEFGETLQHLIGLPNVTVEDWPAILDALDLHREGLDFADALHLVRSARCDHFFTFEDRRFARRAARIGTSPPVQVPRMRS